MVATAQTSRSSKTKNKRRTKKKTEASQADKYDLYLQSVQDPSFEVRILKRLYKDAFGSNPKTLREDFCGTAAFCCEWVKSVKDGEAWGVDLDPEPLKWGAEHNYSALKPAQQERVHLIEGDCRTAKTPKVDVIGAQNFSWFCFKSREELLGYFKAAYKHLDKNGVLALDMLGGPQTQEDDEEEEREVEGFTYVWEQAKFNPITSNALFHIHFDFDDGSRMKKAFTYDWRLWTIPEVRELLKEAGFDEAIVYWEASDEDGDGNGRFYKTEKAPADLTWLAYIAAVKKK
jgi:hypothetical protein